MPYWDESVYYEIPRSKALELIRISEELHGMCLELVDLVIKGKAYGRFDMPDLFIQALEKSWQKSPLRSIQYRLNTSEEK